MTIRKPGRNRRWGATAVETALVMIPLMMFIFGVFEYSRLLLDWNLLNNGAREGCRYALVNNTDAAINSKVSGVVNGYVGAETARFNNFTITVSGTHLGVATAVNNLVPGDLITVTVSGQYKFMNVIPLVKMPTLTITSACTMVCEGAS